MQQKPETPAKSNLQDTEPSVNSTPLGQCIKISSCDINIPETSDLDASVECSQVNTPNLSDSQTSTDLDSPLSHTLLQEKLSKSLDFTTNEMLEVLEIKTEVERLTLELASTHNQFEEVSIENNRLKRMTEKLQREVETLKRQCLSTNTAATLRCVKNKRHSLYANSLPTPSTPGGTNSCPNDCTTEIQQLNQLIKRLEDELSVYRGKISQLIIHVESLVQGLRHSEETAQYTANITTPLRYFYEQSSGPNHATPGRKIQPSLLQSRLCVISNHSNHMVKLLKQELSNASTCIYLTPGAGTHELFSGLQHKLQDFTLSDFCVIYIGDKDFKTSTNYHTLVELIQEQLSQVQNTNIIICLPTFKISEYSNLFTKRVETFNNLLYQTNLTNEFCHILDSNLHLSYERDMFSKFGNVNRLGFRTIFNDLIHLLNALSCDLNLSQINKNIRDTTLPDDPTETQFFRSNQELHRSYSLYAFKMSKKGYKNDRFNGPITNYEHNEYEL